MNASTQPISPYVPGKMRCSRCNFTLLRTTLYVRTNTAGPGDHHAENCPNGCGPLWPQTWQEEAQDLGERLEDILDETAIKTDALEEAKIYLAEYRRELLEQFTIGGDRATMSDDERMIVYALERVLAQVFQAIEVGAPPR